MPVYESTCVAPSCRLRGRRFERYYKKPEYVAPECPGCGATMEQLMSAPNVCWARPLGDYSDKRLAEQQGQKIEDGHWVTRVRSNRNRDGSIDREYITNRAQQLKYCREEGLVDPMDTRTVEATPDGLKSSTQGNKGSWV